MDYKITYTYTEKANYAICPVSFLMGFFPTEMEQANESLGINFIYSVLGYGKADCVCIPAVTAQWLQCNEASIGF